MEEKKGVKNYGIILSILIYALVYFLVIVKQIPNYAAIINGLFICVVTFVGYLLYGFQKYSLNEIRKKINKEVIISLVVYFTIINILGIFTGFLKNSYSLEIISILKHTIIPLVSVVALEFFRYMYVTSNKDSIPKVMLGTIAIMLLDVAISYYNFGSSLVAIFVFLSVTVLPIIFKNAVLSYLTYHVGYHAGLLYVIPLAIYKYFVPVLPDLGNYLTCIVNITLPSMIFIYASRMINDFLNEKENKLNIFRIMLLDIPLVFIFTVFVGLISGYFSYHLIGVNTSAISPRVERGDAAMIFKDYKYEDIKKGDVIAYKGDHDYIIDVIADKKRDGEKVTLYIKTEINEGEEDTLREITEDEIVGIYKFRIRKIAYPTIWFREFIRGDANEG